MHTGVLDAGEDLVALRLAAAAGKWQRGLHNVITSSPVTVHAESAGFQKGFAALWQVQRQGLQPLQKVLDFTLE